MKAGITSVLTGISGMIEIFLLLLVRLNERSSLDIWHRIAFAKIVSYSAGFFHCFSRSRVELIGRLAGLLLLKIWMKISYALASRLMRESTSSSSSEKASKTLSQFRLLKFSRKARA